MINIDEQLAGVKLSQDKANNSFDQSNQKQQWLAAWEKAYLENSESNTGNSSSKNRTQNPSPITNSAAIPASVANVQMQDVYQEDANGLMKLPVLSPDAPATNGVEATNFRNLSGKQDVIGVLANVDVKSLSQQALKTVSGAEKITNPEVASQEKHQTFRVSTNGTEVSVWMRDVSAKNSGQQIINELQSVLRNMGLKLVYLKLNGENVFGREQVAAMDSDATSEHKINKVI